LTLPIVDPAGHAIGLCVPLPNCSSVQAASPLAAAGLIVMPSGSVTETSLTCAVARPLGSSFCGTCRSTAALVGSSACVVPGVTEIEGLNGTSSQSVAPCGWPLTSVSLNALACVPDQDVTFNVVRCGPAQAVGRLRNGFFVPMTADPLPRQTGMPRLIVQLTPRSSLCSVAHGTPQNVSFDRCKPPAGARFGTLLIVKNRPASVVSRTPPMMCVSPSTGIEKAKSESPSVFML
jgi:hypothetical protein